MYDQVISQIPHALLAYGIAACMYRVVFRRWASSITKLFVPATFLTIMMS